MTPRSKRLLGFVGLLAVALVLVIFLRLPGPSDRDQILAQMETARAAAQRSNVSGIMQIVSADYHGSSAFDGNVDQLHVFLLQVFRGSNGPLNVSLAPPSVQVQGDQADTVGEISIRSAEGGVYEHPVMLHWKRERGTRWLIVPAKVWRVVGAEFQPPGGDEGGGLL